MSDDDWEWVCPPCRRGIHDGCMQPSVTDIAVCTCEPCVERDHRRPPPPESSGKGELTADDCAYE